MNGAKSTDVAVVIPTYNRGTKVFETLRRCYSCQPAPDEVWVHVDASDGRLEADIAQEFPDVRILSSKEQLGPGGGRDRCLRACTSEFAASFDDDSYPVDPDFFKNAASAFAAHPDAAVLESQTWHPHEQEIARTLGQVQTLNFTGCGHVMRVSAYRAIPGYLSERVAYGVEEVDLALQFYAAGWTIYRCGDLRVFHNTTLEHRLETGIIAGTISNVALFAYVNYPFLLWPVGIFQLLSMLVFCLRSGRAHGILAGLSQIPSKCYKHRRNRRPLPMRTVLRFLGGRRSGAMVFQQ